MSSTSASSSTATGSGQHGDRPKAGATTSHPSVTRKIPRSAIWTTSTSKSPSSRASGAAENPRARCSVLFVADDATSMQVVELRQTSFDGLLARQQVTRCEATGNLPGDRQRINSMLLRTLVGLCPEEDNEPSSAKEQDEEENPEEHEEQ